MKTIAINIALLIGLTSAGAWAQAGSVTSSQHSTTAARGMHSAGQGGQSAVSGQKNGSAMGSGTTRPATGSGSAGGQSNGQMSAQGSKATAKRVNQQAAGVPNGPGTNKSNAQKSTRNQ